MVTETMIIIALRQKNWEAAAEMAHEFAGKNPESEIAKIVPAIESAEKSIKAAWLLSIFSEIKWREMNEVKI
ncbi:hypothetical protein J6Z19_04550 [bacterium]|nr:hypothetical protein [bacterium]